MTARVPPVAAPRGYDEAWRQIRLYASQAGAAGSFAWNVRVLTASATAVAGDFCDVDASGGAVSVTLPSAAGNVGRMISVSKADSSANAVTIIGTVNGTVNPTLTVQYTCALMVSNGTEWRRLA